MVVLVEIVALAIDDVDRRHDHAGRAVAALQTVILAERFLHRMQLRRRSARPSIVVIEAPSHLPGQHGAGLDGHAVEMNHAGAALGGVAADMGAGQAQIFAQEFAPARCVSSTSAVTGLPFTVMETAASDFLPNSRAKRPLFAFATPGAGAAKSKSEPI